MSKVSLEAAQESIEKVFEKYAVEGSDPPMLTQDGLLKLMTELLPKLMKLQEEINPGDLGSKLQLPNNKLPGIKNPLMKIEMSIKQK